MGIMERPLVTKMADGGKYWEHTYEKFYLKAYLPATEIDGQVNNYNTLQAVQNAGADFVVMLPCTVQSIVSHVREIARMASMGKQAATPQQIVEEHLRRLGLPPHLAGFAQLRTGIPLFAQDENQQLEKELYPAIAELCGNRSVDQVERSIRQTIKEAWKNGDKKVWAEYFPGRTTAPTNKVFIAVLAQRLRQSDPDRIW